MADAAQREVDVVVLGAGPVGENVAQRVVQGGLSAVLVEAELVGGECSFWACMPSKALLRPGQALSAARRVDGARQAVTGDLDVKAVLHRRDTFTHDWDDSSQVQWADGAGIEVVRGRGRLVGERRVEVVGPEGTSTLAARTAVVVCTGSVPSEPPIDGLADVPHWGSREATAAKAIPGRLVVLGGGVVACEMAQAHQRLGAEVVLLAQHGLLARAEPFAADLVAAGLRADGVDVRLEVQTESVERHGEGVRVRLVGGDVVDGDQLLVATGRRPTTRDIGVEGFGLEAGHALEVDDSGQVVGVDGGWLYAAGDVTGRAPLTHQGKYGARAAGDAIVARARGELRGEPPAWSRYAATADHAAVPQVVFTDPEVAWVGLTDAEAREQGLPVRSVDVDMGSVAGAALLADGYEGTARIVVDTEREVIVGATFAGPDVAELLHAATIAVVAEVPLQRLWHAVPSYPSVSEVWLRLLEGYGL